MELIPWLLPLLVISIYTIYIATKTKRTHGKPPLPPGPRPLPLVGNLFLLGHLPHRSIAALAKLHGPIMTLRLGLTTNIIISSPDAAREALQKHDHLLSDRWVADGARPLVGSVIWSSPNQHWKQLRAIMTANLFSTRSLERSKGLRQEKARELVAFFDARAGREVDLSEAFFSLQVDLILAMTFSSDGERLGSKHNSVFKGFVAMMAEAFGKPNVSDFFPFLRDLDLQGCRRGAVYHAKNLTTIFDELIDRRWKSWSARDADSSSADFLDCLLQLYSESKLELSAIKSVIVDLFLASTETNYITLEWAMAELLRNPETLARAQAEVRDVIGPQNQVYESDIARLPYLQAVLKEVLRLHPAGPFLVPHKPMQDVELGGYLVPKGVRVMVNVWAIAHDENIWPEPEVFRPERFFENDVDYRGHDFKLIPFGSGRRICPGLPLAAKMMPLILASLLNSFEWRLEDGTNNVDMKEKFGVTLSMAVPLRAIPFPIGERVRV